MIAKYLIAGAISAALAGGAVFMVADASEIAHPHDTVSKRGKTADDRAPAPEAEADATTSPEKESPSQSATTIDRLLSKPAAPAETRRSDASGKTSWMRSTRSDDEGGDAASRPQPKPSEARDDDKPKRAWLDDYLKPEPDEKDAPDTAHSSDHMMSDTEREAENPMWTTRETLDIEIEMEKGDAPHGESAKRRYSDMEAAGNNSEREAERMWDRSLNTTTFSEPDYAMLIKQAGKIEIDKAREAAFYDIALLAGRLQDDAALKSAMAELGTPELRDTARQGIGVALAKDGKVDEAFAVLKDLEIEALADPVRAAIIHAATVRGR